MIKYTTSMKVFNDKKTNTPICETAIDSDAYEKICKTLKCCYEVIPDDVPVCLYADIDCKHAYGEFEFLQLNTNMFIGYAKQAITKVCFEYNPRFAVATASSPDYMDDGIRKMCHSIHIHIPNIKMMKNEQHIFWKKMNDLMNTHIELKGWSEHFGTQNNKFFDESVYNKNGKLRSVYCSKINQNRPLILVEGTFKETIVSLGDEDAIVKNVDISEKQTKKTHNKCSSVITFSNESNNCDEKLLELGNIIEIKYLDEYYDWTRIVWSLRSESEKYEISAREISKRSKKYTDDGFDKIWNGFNKENITIGTFYNYCKISNEKAYNEICAKYCYFATTDDIIDLYKCAKLIAPRLRNAVILCNETWYVIQPNKLWNKVKEPTYQITSEIRKYIDYSNAKLTQEIKHCEGAEKDKKIADSKIYLDFYKMINGNSYMSPLMKNLRALLSDNEFDLNLDILKFKIAYKNGILDLKTLHFREGILSSDLITKTIPYNYEPSIKSDRDVVLHELLKICNMKPSHLDYYLSYFGYSMTGDSQKLQEFWYMLGQTASNGKSVVFETLMEIIPNYIVKIESDAFEPNNNNFHKEVATWKGARIGWINELSKKQQDPELIKQVCDGTSVKYKVMYGVSSNMPITFKMCVVSNNSISINADRGVARRLKILQMDSSFDDKYVVDNFEECKFKKDTKFGELLQTTYKFALMDIIYSYSKRFIDSDFKMCDYPDEWRNETDECLASNNDFAEYFNDHYITDPEGQTCKRELDAFIKAFGKPIKIKDELKRMGVKFSYASKARLGKERIQGVYTGFNKTKHIADNNESDNK
jgi:hypothetical protein